MRFLDEFFDYKNEIMKELCSDADIVRLVTGESDPTLPCRELAYTQIFPYEYVPDTTDSATTFICFDVDISEVLNKTFLVPVIYFWVFTHKSKLRLPEGGARTDAMAAQIDALMNGNRYMGLGELNLANVQRFSPITDYQGRVLTYVAKDFNRPGVSRTPPAQRK